MELYKKMLTDYPGSVYVVEARTAYRNLQEFNKTNPGQESLEPKDNLLFEGKSPNP